MDGVIKRASPSQRKFTYSRAAARISSKSPGIRFGHRAFRYSRSHRRTKAFGQECVKEARSISPGAIAVDCQSAGQLIPFRYTMFWPKYSPWITVCGASSKIGTRDSNFRHIGAIHGNRRGPGGKVRSVPRGQPREYALSDFPGDAGVRARARGPFVAADLP